MTRVAINVGGKPRTFGTYGWKPGRKFFSLADSVQIRFDRAAGEALPRWDQIAFRVTDTALEARELNGLARHWVLPHDKWAFRMLDFIGNGVRGINFFDALAGYDSFASTSGRDEVEATDFVTRLQTFQASSEQSLPCFARGLVTDKGVVFDFGKGFKGLLQHFWAPSLVRNQTGERVLLTANKYEGRVMVSGFTEDREGKARVFCEHFFDGWGFYDVLKGDTDNAGLRLYHVFTEQGYFYFDDVLVVLTGGRTRTDRQFGLYTDRERVPLFVKGSHASPVELHHYFDLKDRGKLVACAPADSWSKSKFGLITGERDGLTIAGRQDEGLTIYAGINNPFIVPRERARDFLLGERVRGRFEEGVLVGIYPNDSDRPYVELLVRISVFDGEKFVLAKVVGENLQAKDCQGTVYVTGRLVALYGNQTKQVKVGFGGESLCLAFLPEGVSFGETSVSVFGHEGELLYYDFRKTFEGRNLEIVLAAARVIKAGEHELVRHKEAMDALVKEKTECLKALLEVGRLREIEEGFLKIFLDEPASLRPLREAMEVRKAIFQREIFLRKRAIDREELENIVGKGDFAALAGKLLTRGNRKLTFLLKAHLLDVLYGISKESKQAEKLLAGLPKIFRASSRALPKILEILSATSDGAESAAAIRAVYATAKPAPGIRPKTIVTTTPKAAKKPKAAPALKAPALAPVRKPKVEPAPPRPIIRTLPPEWRALVNSFPRRVWDEDMGRGIKFAIRRFEGLKQEIQRGSFDRSVVLNRLALLQSNLESNYLEALRYCGFRVGLGSQANFLRYMKEIGIPDLAMELYKA